MLYNVYILLYPKISQCFIPFENKDITTHLQEYK